MKDRREIKEEKRSRRDQRGGEIEIKKEEREKERRWERKCGFHNATSSFNCHMSYLTPNLTVLSR